MQRKQLESCVNLYKYILSQEPNDVSAKEHLGDLYHALDDDRRALSYWEQCDTASAYYNCGKLYQYPKINYIEFLSKNQPFTKFNYIISDSGNLENIFITPAKYVDGGQANEDVIIMYIDFEFISRGGSIEDYRINNIKSAKETLMKKF